MHKQGVTSPILLMTYKGQRAVFDCATCHKGGAEVSDASTLLTDAIHNGSQFSRIGTLEQQFE